MKILFSVLLLLGACSFKKKQLENQTLKGHEELYSMPKAPKLSDLEDHQKKIVIAATNDIQGSYGVKTFSFKDSSRKSQDIRIGGADVVLSYFKILREQYENVVLVDSGNIFSSKEPLKSAQDFYSIMGYDAVTLGLGDFNLKLPSGTNSTTDLFKSFAKNSKAPLTISNLYELKTARLVEWPGTKPHVLKEINGVKVGIVGIVPDDITTKTPVNNRVGLFVENMLQSTLGQARLLRSLGADVIVVITHQSIDCGTELALESKLPLMKVNFEPRREKACNLNSILGEYLQRLPPGLVDVVVGGRINQKTANFVNGTLVMSGFDKGRSFSYAEFTVDTETKKIIPSETVAHQPVLFCREFFKETNDCFYEDPTVNHKERVPAVFLGKPVEPDVMIEEIFPELKSDKKSAAVNENQNVRKGLADFKADLSYVPETTGHSQLIVVEVTGSSLLKTLEEDFNNARSQDWKPSPYSMKGPDLSIAVAGEAVSPLKKYRILTDLEGIHRSLLLLKSMKDSGSELLTYHSWNSVSEGSDSVSTQLAAPGH